MFTTVSVIIPTYNRADYLRAAIESVLTQTRPVDEIIVIDDGSTDHTADVVQRLADLPSTLIPLKYFYQPNSGPASARNFGISLAHGVLIAFQDSDDLWLPNKNEIQVNILDTHSQIDIVMGYSQIFLEKFDDESKFHEPILQTTLQCATFRRKVFDRVGLFDLATVPGEDIDWYLRAWEAELNIHADPEAVVYYLRHLESLTAEKGRLTKNTLNALRASIHRRKQSGATPNKRFLSGEFFEEVLRNKTNA